MCYPWRCPGRWPVCIQLYGHGAEAPIDGYCTRILAFRGLSACQGSLNSSKIVVNEMVLTCLKCPWIQCFQGIIRFWLDFLWNNQEVSFCVGVDDTSDLVAGRWYYWYINGTKGTTANNYPNDGRFKVTAQRGYRLLGSGTWSVFADEHEAIRSLGIPSNLNWVPADENAWTYAAANDDWNFDSSTDPVK